jgi:YD repeat-containing protein
VVENAWVDQHQSAATYGASVTLTAGTPVPIQVDYYENMADAQMALVVNGPGLPTDGVVPSSWLSTSVSSLPLGWSMSAPGESSSMYTRVIAGWGSVTLVDATGGTHVFKAVSNSTGTTYQAPAGEDVSLVANPGGGYTAQEAGMTTSFDAAGHLVAVRTGTDDHDVASTSFEWAPPPGAAAGTPTRLTKIIDPVSNATVMNIHYAGDSACPTPPTGYDTAPPTGMICGIGYWSTNPSDGTQAATALFYSNGQLSAVVNPGGEATDFAYDTNGMLNGVRNPAQADWAAANPTYAGDLAYATQISYDSAGRAATIAPATPSVGGARGTHSFVYIVGGASTSRVHIAGMAEPIG